MGILYLTKIQELRKVYFDDKFISKLEAESKELLEGAGMPDKTIQELHSQGFLIISPECQAVNRKEEDRISRLRNAICNTGAGDHE